MKNKTKNIFFLIIIFILNACFFNYSSFSEEEKRLKLAIRINPNHELGYLIIFLY